MRRQNRTAVRPALFAPCIALAAVLAAGAFDVSRADERVAYPVAQPQLFDEDISCYNATLLAQQFVPYFMVADEPDSLLATLDWWAGNCGSAEPIRRMRILAAIWDGAFTEDLYDTRLIDDLAWRYDPERLDAQRRGDMVRPRWGSVASTVDFIGDAAGFDGFTADVADQLLPHQAPGTPEEFFCLFYSGRTDEAYALLRGPDLAGTGLYELYHAELETLAAPSYRDYWGAGWGYRRAMGGLAALGHQQTVGLFAGRSAPRGFVEAGLDLRLGRADRPFYVRDGDFYGFSDRYGWLALGVDAGLTVRRFGPVACSAFVGGALEALNPFRKQDDIVLTAGRFSLGARLQYERRPESRWFSSVDWRRSWTGDPPEEGTDLGGDSWSMRWAVGFFWSSPEADRRAVLGD